MKRPGNITQQEEAQVIKIAQEWIRKNMKSKEWPEDDWYALSDEWDINVYLWPRDEDINEIVPKAAVYHVVDGNTNADSWIGISLKNLNDEACAL